MGRGCSNLLFNKLIIIRYQINKTTCEMWNLTTILSLNHTAVSKYDVWDAWS